MTSVSNVRILFTNLGLRSERMELAMKIAATPESSQGRAANIGPCLLAFKQAIPACSM